MATIISHIDAMLRVSGVCCALIAILLPGQVFSGSGVPLAPPAHVAMATSTVPAARPIAVDFKTEEPSIEVREIAGWVMHTGNHGGLSFVIIDKKNARVFVFHPDGKLRGATPALLGAAVGDDSVPGIGERKMSTILLHERTTPAGRFVSEPGINAAGEDIVWVDYDAAVSMHRVRANVPRERRLQRLASITPDDNRISFGCINIPVAFYESVVKPALGSSTGIVYILPETRTLESVFEAYRVASKR